ncbi:MAG: inositol 2-dehydrogenase [Anaerovoracaceae bacterium]
MAKMKVGIIGVGRIGKVHTLSIKNQIPEVEILAVSDINFEEARRWAKEMNIPNAYESYEEIINNPEIDAVLICSATDTHADISSEAAKAGKHIFCEKPVDLTIEKVEQVIAEAKAAGVKLQIGFNRRFDHNFRKVRELIADGTLGDLQILRITSRDPEPAPAEHSKWSGGMFNDMTIHDFDMARFMTGSEPVEVYAVADAKITPSLKDFDDFDTAMITITFENGAFCTIDNSRKAVYGYDQRVEAFGSKGKAEISNDAPSTAVWSTADGIMSEKPKYFFLERYMDSFAEEMKQFMAAIINDTETPVVGFDGLQPLKMGLAAKKSVLEKRAVKLSEIIG